MKRALPIAFALMLVLQVPATKAQSTPPRKDIPTIAKAANGAIVSIVMSKDGQPLAQGSGFLVSKDGLVVTNYHVIAQGSSAVVKLPDGAFYAVEGVVASDKSRDIAVIKTNGKNFRTLTLGNSDRLQVGEQVVAIGNPLSLESTVSNGIVSGIRAVKDGKFLQITAPISHGSSGGPLFNMAGEVVGITAAIVESGENLNFAIPINDAKQLLVANSSKLQNLPNESELARADGVPSTVDDGSSASNIARHYYRQLLSAGAFLLLGKDTPKGMMPTQDYACFSDDPHSDTFFTFIAYGYDQEYEEASSKWNKLLPGRSSSDYAEIERYYAQMQKIQRNNGYDYMRFIRADVLNSYPPDVQKVYRDGAHSLDADIYESGVKTKTLTYVELDHNGEWHGQRRRLIIEPSTMRYKLLYLGPTNISESGVCEKVTDPK